MFENVLNFIKNNSYKDIITALIILISGFACILFILRFANKTDKSKTR